MAARRQCLHVFLCIRQPPNAHRIFSYTAGGPSHQSWPWQATPARECTSSYVVCGDDMGANRVRIWRGGATGVALWALLATAATLELYDEVPPEVESPTYQDVNFIDTGSLIESQKGGPDLALAKDVLLYRLIQSLQRDSQTAPKIRPDWQIDNQEPPQRRTVHPTKDLKDAIVKRLTNALHRNGGALGFRSLDQMYSPQQKWKIKKGKSLGSHMVCYFKLCAFRSPV